MKTTENILFVFISYLWKFPLFFDLRGSPGTTNLSHFSDEQTLLTLHPASQRSRSQLLCSSLTFSTTTTQFVIRKWTPDIFFLYLKINRSTISSLKSIKFYSLLNVLVLYNKHVLQIMFWKAWFIHLRSFQNSLWIWEQILTCISLRLRSGTTLLDW